jgi:probable rRNA maturation factor
MTAASPRVAPSGVTVDVLTESPLWEAEPGAEAVVRQAILQAAAVVGPMAPGSEVAVLLCDDATIAALNAQWRGREEPTNVLSFPAPPASKLPASDLGASDPGASDSGASGGGISEAGLHLGDIAIACETVVREAREQGRPVSQHLAHLAVHGFLHLLGYDHQADSEAERMEGLEREILATLGISDPYAPHDA